MNVREQVKTEDVKVSLADIYTPLSVAKEELRRRWNNKELRKKVEDFLGGDVLAAFQDNPVAALFRFIATPNLELQIAVEMSRLMGIEMTFWEFLNDKFCTRNQDKVHLGKLVFLHQNSPNRFSVNKKRVIDLEKSDGHAFKELKTTDGASLVDFHHDLLQRKYGHMRTFDVSVFKTNGETAEEVYEKVFAFFTCYGVLLENYVLKEDHYERKFVLDTILPAMRKVESMFGVKPLVVPLLPMKSETDQEWMWYSDN